jgi:hypothetical protein
MECGCNGELKIEGLTLASNGGELIAEDEMERWWES